MDCELYDMYGIVCTRGHCQEAPKSGLSPGEYRINFVCRMLMLFGFILSIRIYADDTCMHACNTYWYMSRA